MVLDSIYKLTKLQLKYAFSKIELTSTIHMNKNKIKQNIRRPKSAHKSMQWLRFTSCSDVDILLM